MNGFILVATALVVPGCLAASVDPSYAQNLTLYHLNEANYSGIDNMNTADAAGDAFFDINSYMIPQLCRNKSQHTYPGECTNPEYLGADLVITRVKVEVDVRFGDYGRCNICTDGVVPFSRPPKNCTVGEYVCVCGGYERSEPCGPQVGYENITSHFGAYTPRPDDDHFEFWRFNLANRTGGGWFSTLNEGKGVTWQLIETEKEVNASCHRTQLLKSIQKIDPSCFDACPQPQNGSSDCVVDCVYDTLLGPEARKTAPAPGGLSGEQITGIWVGAFEACPSRPPAPPGPSPSPSGNQTTSLIPGDSDLNQLCYQAESAEYAQKVQSEDPLAKKHALYSGSCADKGFSVYERNDPIFKEAELWAKKS